MAGAGRPGDIVHGDPYGNNRCRNAVSSPDIHRFRGVRLLSNGPPVADASDAPTVFAGYLAELDGAGSTDPDGDELTYEWTMQSRPEDSAIELVTPDMATVSFTPDIPGE